MKTLSNFNRLYHIAFLALPLFMTTPSFATGQTPVEKHFIKTQGDGSEPEYLRSLTQELRLALDHYLTVQEQGYGDDPNLWLAHMHSLFSAMYTFHNTAFQAAYKVAREESLETYHHQRLETSEILALNLEVQASAMNAAQASAWSQATQASRSRILHEREGVATSAVYHRAWKAASLALKPWPKSDIFVFYKAAQHGVYTYRKAEFVVLKSFIASITKDLFTQDFSAPLGRRTHTYDAETLQRLWAEWQKNYAALDEKSQHFLAPWVDHLTRINAKIMMLLNPSHKPETTEENNDKKYLLESDDQDRDSNLTCTQWLLEMTSWK